MACFQCLLLFLQAKRKRSRMKQSWNCCHWYILRISQRQLSHSVIYFMHWANFSFSQKDDTLQNVKWNSAVCQKSRCSCNGFGKMPHQLKRQIWKSYFYRMACTLSSSGASRSTVSLIYKYLKLICSNADLSGQSETNVLVRKKGTGEIWFCLQDSEREQLKMADM